MSDVLLVDDHALLAQALAWALRGHGHSVDVLAVEGRTLAELLAPAAAAGLVVLDLDLGAGPDGVRRDGAALLAPLRERGVPVVVSTGSNDLARWGQCLAAGAAAVLHKGDPLDDLVAVVDAVTAGRTVAAPPWRSAALSAWRRRRAQAEELLGPLRRLTPRENEVLHRLAEGVAAGEIAATSVVSEATVRAQIRSILAKLGVSSQLQAAALLHRARTAGLVAT